MNPRIHYYFFPQKRTKNSVSPGIFGITVAALRYLQLKQLIAELIQFKLLILTRGLYLLRSETLKSYLRGNNQAYMAVSAGRNGGNPKPFRL